MNSHQLVLAYRETSTSLGEHHYHINYHYLLFHHYLVTIHHLLQMSHTSRRKLLAPVKVGSVQDLDGLYRHVGVGGLGIITLLATTFRHDTFCMTLIR